SPGRKWSTNAPRRAWVIAPRAFTRSNLACVVRWMGRLAALMERPFHTLGRPTASRWHDSAKERGANGVHQLPCRDFRLLQRFGVCVGHSCRVQWRVHVAGVDRKEAHATRRQFDIPNRAEVA